MKILLTADWHIRGDRPRCRIDDDWIGAQRRDIQEVHNIADREECDEVWIMGDLFHQPRCSTEAVVMVLDELSKFPQTIRVLPGNHDLPYHDYGNLDCCSLGIVLKSYPELVSQVVGLDLDVYARPFGHDDPAEASLMKPSIYCTHQLVYPNKDAKPLPDLPEPTAQDLLDKAPGVPLVITGDYHHGYVYTAPDGRRVVTPGCLNIQAADMTDYHPRVYVLDTASMAISEHFLPSNGEVAVDYLATEKERDERMDRCLEVATSAASVSLSFTDNLQAELNCPEHSPGIKGIIQEVLDSLNKDRQ